MKTPYKHYKLILVLAIFSMAIILAGCKEQSGGPAADAYLQTDTHNAWVLSARAVKQLGDYEIVSSKERDGTIVAQEEDAGNSQAIPDRIIIICQAYKSGTNIFVRPHYGTEKELVDGEKVREFGIFKDRFLEKLKSLFEESGEGNVEKIATGLMFSEGPVWSPRGTLLFSDIPADTIYELSMEKKVYRKPSGNSNGLAFNALGMLVACEHGTRSVTMSTPDGKRAALADNYEGKRLNSPNDLDIHSSGAIYFTDPPYGVDEKDRELDFCGVYRLQPATGELLLLTKDFEKPNGICFSPDEKLLYIADSSERAHIMVYEVGEDGGIDNGRLFAELDQSTRPDGMKVDSDGNLYASCGNYVFAWDPGGKNIEKIDFGENTTNLCWGEDENTLYVTATSSVYRVRLEE